jgi:recombination protein RecA
MALKEDLKKTFGDDILMSGNSIKEKEVIVIPLSPSLDMILNGGVPEGSFVVLTGQPKCGKTVTSLSLAATALEPKYQGSLEKPRHAYYLNIEGRLKKRDIEGIKGLDLERFTLIGSTQGKILHAEEYLQIAERIINQEPGSIIIIDSYSALCTEAEITSDMNKMQRADGAKLLAKFCRKVANVIPVNKNIVVGITHLMGNPTGYGAEFKEKSGQAIAYQTDIKLRAKKFSPWLLGKENTQIGQEVEWQVICSALGPPGATTTSYIRYGEGIDKSMELFNMAVDIGIISKGGAWYTFADLENSPKFQGAEKARDFMVSNPDIYEALSNKVKEALGV